MIRFQVYSHRELLISARREAMVLSSAAGVKSTLGLASSLPFFFIQSTSSSASNISDHSFFISVMVMSL